MIILWRATTCRFDGDWGTRSLVLGFWSWVFGCVSELTLGSEKDFGLIKDQRPRFVSLHFQVSQEFGEGAVEPFRLFEIRDVPGVFDYFQTRASDFTVHHL